MTEAFEHYTVEFNNQGHHCGARPLEGGGVTDENLSNDDETPCSYSIINV